MLRIPKVLVFAAVALFLSGALLAQDLKPITLPAPQMHGGKPVMDALALRATSRDFSTKDLPLQTLSNLLWAADGINRPKEGLRTAPAAVDWFEIGVYVVMKAGTYVYDAATNTLKPDVSDDYRALTGIQPFVKDPPITLVFVSDASRMVYPPGFPKDLMDAAEKDKAGMTWADAAVISENVYIFCASAGLATGLPAAIDKPALADALKLDSSQTVIMAQCVGSSKK
jgi:hypothetical protein